MCIRVDQTRPPLKSSEKQAQAGNRFTHTTLSQNYSVFIIAVIITIVISITLLFFHTQAGCMGIESHRCLFACLFCSFNKYKIFLICVDCTGQ